MRVFRPPELLVKSVVIEQLTGGCVSFGLRMRVKSGSSDVPNAVKHGENMIKEQNPPFGRIFLSISSYA